MTAKKPGVRIRHWTPEVRVKITREGQKEVPIPYTLTEQGQKTAEEIKRENSAGNHRNG